MKKLILSIFTIFICFACNADCIELKRSVILKTASQTCEPNTLYLLQSLKECGFDSIEIEIFTSQPIFVQIMQSLILNNDSDISIEDFILGFNEFKKNEKFSEYYEGTKQSLEFYSEVITSNNINSHLSILEGFNGTKQAESFKSFLKKQNFIDAGISFKKGFREFYMSEYKTDVFEKNLSGIEFRNVPETKIPRKYYKDRISIKGEIVDSEIVLEVVLNNDWMIIEPSKESNDPFGTSISSNSDCIVISNKIISDNVISKESPINPDGVLRIIKGKTIIRVPFKRQTKNCNEKISLKMTFSLFNEEGTSLPFINETITLE